MRPYLRRVRRFVKACVGTDLITRLDTVVSAQRFGSDYGGWVLARENLDADSVVYSFGIGEDISFDIDLIRAFGLTVHAFDPTPKSIVWVKAQNPPDQFRLHEYGLAAFDGQASFHPPDNPRHVSHTMLENKSAGGQVLMAPVKRLRTVMEELGHGHIDVLKMDIEGAEYQVIDDICRSDIRPAQILVEFHHRFPMVGVGATKRAIGQLRGVGYRLFSVSESGQEFCFLHGG
jgi:FkbM family methyltransferase